VRRDPFEAWAIAGPGSIATTSEAEYVSRQAGKMLVLVARDIHRARCARNEHRRHYVAALDNCIATCAAIQAWLMRPDP